MKRPSSSWVKVTTPSTVEVPLRTATAFLVAATTARGLLGLAAEREKERDWRGKLRETPWKEELRLGLEIEHRRGPDDGEDARIE